MFVGITNTPRDYAWGSTSAIAQLLGREPSGRPEAELWLGAHSGSPARILDPQQTGGARTLAEWIERDPASALGEDYRQLPFLLKVLAADAPLSLQAHPSPQQAAEGFERENRLGIPLDAPERNYKDAFHKPELIFALSDRFEALCGFRPVAASGAVFCAFAEAAKGRFAQTIGRFSGRLAASDDDAGVLRQVLGLLLAGGDDVQELLDALTSAAQSHVAGYEAESALMRDLSKRYPGDPGVALALLLNRVTLRRGEVLYLPAGNIHAYLNGLGVELMAASDNVLRGGLTPKHVDVAELMSVLDFTPRAIPLLQPASPAVGVHVFRPDVPDFQLVQLDVTGGVLPFEPTGPAVALCTEGTLSLRGTASEKSIERGDALYVTPDEGPIRVGGAGTLFVAMPNELSAGPTR